MPCYKTLILVVLATISSEASHAKPDCEEQILSICYEQNTSKYDGFSGLMKYSALAKSAVAECRPKHVSLYSLVESFGDLEICKRAFADRLASAGSNYMLAKLYNEINRQECFLASAIRLMTGERIDSFNSFCKDAMARAPGPASDRQIPR